MGAFLKKELLNMVCMAQQFTDGTDSLYNRLKNCPVNAVPVYGNQPIFSCNPSWNNNNCGCGCGNNF